MEKKQRLAVKWPIDTDYCHHGMPLSNGVFGALVWFQDQAVIVTINRADYWDHRGGSVLPQEAGYRNLRGLLEAGEFEQIQNIFQPEAVNGHIILPGRLPMGRFVLRLNDGVTIESAELNMYEGEATVACRIDGQTIRSLRFTVHIDKPMLLCGDDTGLIAAIEGQPAYSFPQVKEHYDNRGIAQSRTVRTASSQGWVQELPADPACAVLVQQSGSLILICAEYGATAEEALKAASGCLDNGEDYEASRTDIRQKWTKLWDQAAWISLSDPSMELMYDLGIYRMLGSSMPGKIAPTLQGPWVEEHRMAPWGGDYHFNINVQCALWPAYGGNLLDCLKPLFEMISGWKPLLAERARIFAGEECDGYQLSHAMDDRGFAIGGMWTGTVDHANTSWVAHLMWQYYRYSMDEDFLMQEAYPFMKKAMNVFLEMLEWNEQQQQFSLPVSVSPEFGGGGRDALGKNSTFFLVNIRFLCDKIIETAERSGLDSEYAGRLREVRRLLPAFATGEWQQLEYSGPNPVCNEEIYLWEGQPLTVSHRHHSHLAGIYPFDTIDWTQGKEKEIVSNTYRIWIDRGMGRWAGWSMPWASIIHARLGNGDMAYWCLKTLREHFMMPGLAARHNVNYEGFSSFAGGDIMQLDAAIAASAAIQELIVQNVKGKLIVFPFVARHLKDIEFGRLRAEGAFLVSGKMAEGAIEYISLYSEKGAVLHMANPFPDGAAIARDSGSVVVTGGIITLPTAAGETIRIEKAGG